jgi:hypothetical protein
VSTVFVVLGLTDAESRCWRAICTCGWRGPDRQVDFVADADARLHAIETADHTYRAGYGAQAATS